VSGIENNLFATSNNDRVTNVIPKAGIPDYWAPASTDIVPMLRVELPVVYGVQPGTYDLKEIKINANNFETVTVAVTDAGDNMVFTVSFISPVLCIVHTIY